MNRISTLTISERVFSFDLAQEFQNQSGLVVHETFSQRILSSLQPVELTVQCRYEALPLRSWLGNPRSYPRSPKNPLPRYEPTSAEIFTDLSPRDQGMLVKAEHLAILLSFQLNGQSGILATTDNLATLCFMRGTNNQVFLIRVFWNQGMKKWFIRAWSFKERIDRGWSKANLLLLPFNF